MLEFADNYLNLVIFNLKNRNGKAREQAKFILNHIFKTFLGEGVLSENNDLLARIIAGLGAD